MSERPAYLHDVFISCSPQDRAWVEEWLLPRLERAGLRVMADYRDFVVGAPRIENIEQAVKNSRHVVIVLTPAWLESEWNAFEGLLARTLDPAARKRKLLPVLLQPCELPDPISSLALEYVNLTDSRWWDKETRRLIRDIHRRTPPLPPEETPRLTRWQRLQWWTRYYRRQARLGAAALVLFCLLLSALTRWPSFQGWQALGRNIPYAWRIARVGDALLVSTSTDFKSCEPREDTGLWRSADQARNWKPVPLNVLKLSDENCTLAAITSFGLAPGLAARIYAATTDVGLLRSDDAGVNWVPVGDKSLPEAHLQSVAVASVNPDHVFVAAQNGGLYRTIDNGETWKRLDGVAACGENVLGKSSLPPAFKVNAIHASGNMIYVGSGDIQASPGPLDGLYVSDDGGNCWQRQDDARKRYSYLALVEIPGESGQLVALRYDHTATPQEKPFDICHLQVGQGCKALWSSGNTTMAVSIDPGRPKVWYAATNMGEVVRGSLDQVGKWEQLASVTRCAIPPTCLAGLTTGFEPDSPLLLANDHVYRLGPVAWPRRLWP